MISEQVDATDGSTRTRLLVAALALVAEDGIQAVSHRATEERAGVSRGLTRYHFKTRDSLLAALLDYVTELDHRILQDVLAAHAREHVVGDPNLTSGVVINQDLGEAFLDHPGLNIARFELYLYAARRPELLAKVSQLRDSFVQVGAPYLTQAGAAQPEAGQRFLTAAFNGFLLDAMLSPHVDYRAWLGEWMARLELAALSLGSGTDAGATVTEESSATSTSD